MKKIIIAILVLAMASQMMTACGKKSDITTDDTLPPIEETELEDTEEKKDPEKDTADGSDKPADGDSAPERPDSTDSDAESDAESETTAPETEESAVRVESITLDKYEVNIEVGNTDMPWVTMLPEDAADKSELWESSDESVATVNYYGRITGVSAGECTVTVTSKDNPEVSATVKVNVRAASNSPTYINGILIANKTYALPSTYNPGVDDAAASALAKMINAAAADGITLYQISGFRSYSTQQTLYNNYVARDGKAEADRYSARPGHSEHQTGLAFDLNSLEQSFGETAEGKWLAENCWKYGFIIRYPQDKEAVTGYMYEPWHVRYLGVETATKVYNSGLCLEEYLGIDSVYAN